MENTNEYLDETKALNPEVLKKINVTAGDGQSNNSGEVRDHNEGLKDKETIPTEFEAVDFCSYKSLPASSKFFSRVQEVSNIVLNGYRVPFCSQDFRPISVPLSRNRVPVLPYTAFISSQGIIGGGALTFSNWMNTTEEGYFGDFILSEEKFCIKMEEKTKSKLMTLVSIWSNEYLDKGVRDSRARPAAVLGDWAYALPPTFSMVERAIRTDVFAAWMYGAYTATNPAEKVTIINNADLRQFMNTNGGNYWPVEANTLCLALGKTPAAALGKIKLLGHNIVIDFDNSMNAARGTATTYNGVDAWEVSAITVNACDFDVAKILNNTFSGTDIQWALLSNTLPLSYLPANNSPFGQNNFDLIVYENTIADQFINFFATHRDYGNKLPVTNNTLAPFVQAWRVFKTVLTQRALIEIGRVGYASELHTYGKTLTDTNFYDMITGSFSCSTIAWKQQLLWIPYEMWIMNGANLKLDDEEYVDGEANVLVNEKYTVPRSQVLFDMTQWSNPGNEQLSVNYYCPNNSGIQTALNFLTFNGTEIGSCVPSTVPNWNSTTETQTLVWIKDQTIDFTYVGSGKNSNSVYRKKMVFTTAVKN